MKRSPELQQAFEQMQPGVLTRDGMLGDDVRSLEEIIDADNTSVADLAVTHEAIADALDDVLAKAKAELGRPVEINDHVTAAYREAMGRIPSPWPAEGVFEKGEVELEDSESDDRLVVTPLGVHLIRAHGFYNGRGSRYRIAPEKACRMLDL